MSRRLTARLGHDDGQTTVLTVGLCAVLVALMLVMLAVTTVQLQHRRLQSLADSAAIVVMTKMKASISICVRIWMP